MEILNVAPRDFYVTIRLSLTQINQILDFLNHCTCEYNSEEEPEFIEAEKYVRDNFFTNLNILTEEMKDAGK